MEALKLVDSAHLPDLPAPFWFIQLFKVLGFVLHLVPMNLWYVGIAVAMILWVRGNRNGKRFSGRLMRQMPVIIAFGVNFGIVPLLFLQVAYHRLFYPATILMAWFWLSIIGLLVVAYYGVYYYAFGLRQEGLSAGRRAAGWIVPILFLAIGLLFANALSLSTRVDAWGKLWLDHSVGGAATGTALNLSDPSLWPRWLLMLGLALGTTAAWSLVDAWWLGPGEGPGYQAWAQRFATRMFLIGAAWSYAAGAWYVLLTWRPEVRSAMFSFPLILLTLPTMAVPGLPLAWLWYHRRELLTRAEAGLAVGLQLAVLAVNAVSRQVVQNLEIRPWLDVAAQPVNTQWSPLVVFLLLFVAAVAVVVWMLYQVVQASRHPANPG